MQLDERLLFLINREWDCPFLDWCAAVVTATELWVTPLVVLGALCAWKGGSRSRVTCLLVVLALVVGDGVFVRGGKLAFARPRPREVLEGVRTVHLARVEPRIRALGMPLLVRLSAPTQPPTKPRSFPSGHAWNSFAAATVIATCHRRRGWLVYVPASLVAYVRIVGGQHWPSDVLVSVVLAPPVTLLVVRLCDRAWAAWAPRVVPGLHAKLPALLARDAAS